jgi:hypothetical protein
VWYLLRMDDRQPDPFSTREILSTVLPDWVVTLSGPYFDEVGPLGRALIWLRWIIVICVPTVACFAYLDSLVPEDQKVEYALFHTAAGIVGLVWGLRIWRRLRDGD